MGKMSLKLHLATRLTSHRITPWLTTLGYQNCFLSAAFIGLAASSVFLIMVKYGKAMRERTKSRYWEIVEAESKKK